MKRAISEQLKDQEEQLKVVGPLVEYLESTGWKLNQLQFGKREWRVPKTPSEASKRERRRAFDGFPVDIAVAHQTFVWVLPGWIVGEERSGCA